MKNFLLIYPTQVTEAPMTLAMLGAVLKQEGWKVHTLVNTFKKPLTLVDFVRKAKEVRADFVGISMITFDVLAVYEIVRTLKTFGFKVIMGGAHPTVCPQECIEAGADCVVIGEGEESLRDIVQGKIKSGIIPRKPRLDISSLPQPDLSVFDHDLFKDGEGFIKGFHRIYTSRGCPGYCTFCDWRVFGQKFKEYDIKEVFEEIKRRKREYGLNSFSIADDCFTVNSDRVFQFCELMKGTSINWRANSRANLVNQKMLFAMKEAGCHSIAFGLESGDPETLERIKKGVSLSDNIRAPKMAHRAGLEVYGCLMAGFPWETSKHTENQITFIREVWNDVSLFQVSGSLMPFPGSVIYHQYAKEFGFEKFWLKPEYQKFGIQVYQNVQNPFAVSNFYQRYFFDDTYIQNEYFFKYSLEYKASIKKMVKEIGRHNLAFMFKGQPIKQKFYYRIGETSMAVASRFPNLEKNVIGNLFSGRSKIEKIRDKRRGIAKSYTNPN